MLVNNLFGTELPHWYTYTFGNQTTHLNHYVGVWQRHLLGKLLVIIDYLKSDGFSNHSTSDIEGCLFPPTFPDYIPLYLTTSSPTLSLFHDDPYMKVMHAYYAKESPIPCQLLCLHLQCYLQCLILKNFFFQRNYCHLRNEVVTDHPSLLLFCPTFNAFEIGESSRKTSLERHEEQIEKILNHLDELSLDRIKHIKDKIKGLGNGQVIIQQDFDNLEAELQEYHTQIAKLQRKQMGNNSKIALTRFRIANLEQIIEDIQVRHQADKESLLNAIYELKNIRKDHRTTRLDTSYSFC
ncbi:hypothetical protein Tco_0900433 [Tanacetum coccineum]